MRSKASLRRGQLFTFHFIRRPLCQRSIGWREWVQKRRQANLLRKIIISWLKRKKSPARGHVSAMWFMFGVWIVQVLSLEFSPTQATTWNIYRTFLLKYVQLDHFDLKKRRCSNLGNVCVLGRGPVFGLGEITLMMTWRRSRITSAVVGVWTNLTTKLTNKKA